MARLPARCFALLLPDSNCQPVWQFNEEVVDLDVTLMSDRQQDCLWQNLRQRWKQVTLFFLSDDKKYDEFELDGLDDLWLGIFMAYAAEQSVLNPHVITDLALYHVGLFCQYDPSDDDSLSKLPCLFLLPSLSSLLDYPNHLNEWADRWVNLIDAQLREGAYVDLAPVRAWWRCQRDRFSVTFRAFPADWHKEAHRTLAQTAVPAQMGDIPLYLPKDDLDDELDREHNASMADDPETSGTSSSAPIVIHQVAFTPDRHTSSHPDEQANHWVERMLQRLGPMPLQQWPSDTTLTVLRKEFPWAHEALDQLDLLMAFWRKIGSGVVRLPPLLLTGPAGCGKTRFAQRLGECLGLPTMAISAVGGGSQQIKGTERAWSNGTPSPLIRFIADHQCPNPLVSVDEIDKQEENLFAGTLQHALLALVEPENARRYHDSFLEVPCDLSAVNWILTANDTHAICGPLLTRLHVVRMGHPRPEHLPGIIEGVRADMARAAQCALDQLPWSEADERWVRQQMGAMFSVREARHLTEKRLMHTVVHDTPVLTVVPPAEAGSPRPEASMVPLTDTRSEVMAPTKVVPFTRETRREP
jgi:hypothetical protein